MRYFITGYQEHGKDTACDYLKEHHNLDSRGSSWMFCKHVMFDRMKDEYGYETPEQCYEDRRNHRQLWYESIKAYNGDNRSALADLIFSEANIYNGIRSRWEFEGIREKYDVKTVWIDASDRLPPESIDSMDLSIEDADIVIDNNTSIESLHAQLDGLAKTMKIDFAKARHRAQELDGGMTP